MVEFSPPRKKLEKSVINFIFPDNGHIIHKIRSQGISVDQMWCVPGGGREEK